MASRGCLVSLLAHWLVMVMQHIILTLALYGFIENSLGQDGLTKYIYLLKIQLYLILKEVLPELLSDKTDLIIPNESELVQPTKIYSIEDLP